MYARLTRISGGQFDEDQVGPMTEAIMSQARAMDGIRGGYWLRSAAACASVARMACSLSHRVRANRSPVSALRSQ